MWFVTVQLGAGDLLDAVLRVEEGVGMFSGTPLSLRREARVYEALSGRGLPIARLYGSSDAPPALLLERVPGSSDLGTIDNGQRSRVYDSFMGAVAALHCVDVESLELDELPRPTTPEEHAVLELDLWEGFARDLVAAPLREPLVEYALGWLRAHVPTRVERTVLVHGDCGPGNFLFAEGEVTALVDLEFAHLGDPMDDLAWISARGGADIVTGPHGERRLAAYERMSGLHVDRTSLAYYRVFALARCAIATSMTNSRGGAALGLAGYLVVHHQMLAQLARALAEAIGVEVEPFAPPALAPTARTRAYDLAIADLVEAVIPALTDRDAKLRARSALTFLHHLRAADQAGADQGAPPPGDPMAAGKRADRDALLTMLRRAERESALWVQPPSRRP